MAAARSETPGEGAADAGLGAVKLIANKVEVPWMRGIGGRCPELAEFCSAAAAGSARGRAEGGARWNTRGKRRRKWSEPRWWRCRRGRKMEKRASGGGEAAEGAGGDDG